MKRYDINALTPGDLAELLTAAGAESITAEEIEADISSGCPVDEENRINLFRYIEFLLRTTND